MRVLSALALAVSLTVWGGAPARAQHAQVVSLDIRGLDVDNLLQFYSRSFGLTVVKDPNLTGAVTIMCPDPVSRQQALDILNSVLEVRGFTSVLSGNLLKIVALSKAVQSRVPLAVGRTPVEGDQVVTQVIPLHGADAGQVASSLTPLVTTGGSIIGDSTSNTLIVTDYASNIARLLQVLDQLDSANAPLVRVFPLEFATASDIATTLTTVFFTQQRTGSTSGANQQPAFMRRLQGGMGAAAGRIGTTSTQSTGPVGQAVADTRTNSILVTAPKDRMDTIAEVIKGLDRPVQRQSNLSVVRLERANAEELATVLTSALGTSSSSRTGTTSSSTSRTSSSSSSRSSSSSMSSLSMSRGAGSRSADDRQAAAAAGTAGTVAAPSGALSSEAIASRLAEIGSSNVVDLANNGVKVVAETNTNSLIITGAPEYAAMMKQLIQDLDQAPPQVLIEAIVAEVALGTERKLGFEWSWTENPHFGNRDLTGVLGTDFGVASGDSTGLRYSLSGTSLSVLMQALASDDKVTILSTPRIFTSNNREAEINISTQTPYVSSVTSSDSTTTYSVEYLDVGVILNVTPQISADGTVTMDVTQEANELLGYQTFGGSMQAPKVATRSADATIRVADGQTVILGGIISSNTSRNVTKVPVLGDLPLIGSLFRSSDVTNERSELLVFLTPRVVRTPEEAAALTRSEQAKSIASVTTDAGQGAAH